MYAKIVLLVRSEQALLPSLLPYPSFEPLVGLGFFPIASW